MNGVVCLIVLLAVGQCADCTIDSQAPRTTCVVRVGTGVVSVGSGVAVSVGGTPPQTVVLTAGHVCERQGAHASVKWATGDQATGHVLYCLRSPDVGFVLVSGSPPAIARLADREPAVGEAVRIGGYAGGRSWRAYTGRVVGRTTAGDLIVDAPAMSGMSGGPAWTNAGVVGVVWGTDGSRAYVTPLRAIHDITQRYVFPWNAWLADRRNNPPAGESSPQGTPPRETVPAGPLVPVDWEQWRERVDSRLGRLEEWAASYEKSHSRALPPAQPQPPPATPAKPESPEITDPLFSVILRWLLATGLPTGVAIAVALLAAWLMRRNLLRRMQTGEPLLVERLAHELASKTSTKLDDMLADALSRAIDRIAPRPEQASEGATRGRKRG